MRNLKKFLALVLAMLMVVSAGATVSAYSDVADDDAYAAAIAALTEWGIVMGTELGEAEDGSDALYEPEADVTRWQMALMMARTLAPEVTDDEWAEGMEIFGDVTEWYGAIAYAYVEGIVNGVSTEELVFKPNDGIKYQDGLIMALRALGYEVDCSGIVYWLDAYTQAKAIGLTENIAISKPEKTMTRGEMAQLIYNMINLPFADGSYSLAIKYYGAEAPAEPEIPAVPTQFVITATPGQAYVKGQHTDATLPEGETAAALLGLQELEAGIPAGDIIYVKASDLGIADADADAYLHYAVTLYDYDAQYNDFVAYEIGEAPVVVRNSAVTESGTTIKVGGYTYFLVSSLTDAARRNEIVVFTGDADMKESLVLLKNKDGNIVNFNGVVEATYAYTLGATNYYVAEEVDTEGNKRAVVISEAAALKRFGVQTADDAVFTEYETLASVSDDTPYQLSLFDDNGDGKYDRAIYNKVYMSVYNKVDDNNKQVDTGATGDKAPYDTKVTSFTDSSVVSKGKIFTYTYNLQLNTVNVLEVLEKDSGTVTNVDIKNNKVTFLTDDGVKTLILAKNDAATDKAMTVNATVAGTAKDSFGKIGEGSLYYTELDDFYYIGSTYDFYEYNGYLLNGKKHADVDEDANWKYFVSAGAVSYDSTAIYVDGYVAGSKDKSTIEISVIDEDVEHPNVKKDTALADMNIFDLGELLADAKDLFAKGNLFRIVLRDDGTYRLLSNKVSTLNRNVADLTSETELDLIKVDGTITFTDGISANALKQNRIRTDDETVFYFIKYTATNGIIEDLDVIAGQPDDGDTIASSAYVYADLVGWSRDKDADESVNSGVANVVFVYYTNELTEIGGFNITTGIDDYAIVYVNPTKADDTGLSIVPGSEVDESATAYFWKMNGKYALDMQTGALISPVYSTVKVTEAGFYKMDENNVIYALDSTKTDEANIIAQLAAKKVEAIDFDDQYVTLDLEGTGKDIVLGNKVTTAYHTYNAGAGEITRYTNNSGDAAAKDIVVGDYVAMLNLDNDNVVVLVEVSPDVCECCADCTYVGGTCGSTCTCTCKQPVTVTGNATYHYQPAGAATSTIQQVAKVVWKDGKVGSFEDLTLEVYDADGTISDLSSVVDPGRCALAIYKDTTTNDVTSTVCAGYAQATEMNGEKMIIDIYKDLLVNDEYLQLEAGQYKIRFTFTNKNVGDTVTRYIETAPFVIEAAE